MKADRFVGLFVVNGAVFVLIFVFDDFIGVVVDATRILDFVEVIVSKVVFNVNATDIIA